jgi:hypothetical protein
MDPVALLLTALLAASPVAVTEDDLTLPDGCRPAQATQVLNGHFGTPAVRLDEVIVGYANGLGQIEFAATVAGGRVHGKGAIDCAARSIVALGFGREAERHAPLCRPSPERRTHATLACVRHWT